jgi:hypothetical protein
MTSGAVAHELRGRRVECAVLARALADVRSGRGRALLIRGEAGVGKSALLDHLVGRSTGCRVARAAGVEYEMELPFAGLHQLCAPMLDRATNVNVCAEAWSSHCPSSITRVAACPPTPPPADSVRPLRPGTCPADCRRRSRTPRYRPKERTLRTALPVNARPCRPLDPLCDGPRPVWHARSARSTSHPERSVR